MVATGSVGCDDGVQSLDEMVHKTMCASIYELQFEPDVAIETFYEPDAIGQIFYETTATALTKGAKRRHIQTRRGGTRRSVKDRDDNDNIRR